MERVFKIKYTKQGGHYHLRVFSAQWWDYTFAKLGDLVLDEKDFEGRHRLFNATTVKWEENKIMEYPAVYYFAENHPDKFQYIGNYEHFQDTIDSMIFTTITGKPAGDFVMPIMNWDLMEAIGRADSINFPMIPIYALFRYNQIPRKLGPYADKATRTWVFETYGKNASNSMRETLQRWLDAQTD